MTRAELVASIRTQAANLRTQARDLALLARDIEHGRLQASASSAWEEFKAEAKPGCCPCCDRKLPPHTSGRKRVICDDPDCETLFQAVYRQSRNRVQP